MDAVQKREQNDPPTAVTEQEKPALEEPSR